MNFDPTLSVENNELANLNVSQNFPNPFANETTVLFNLKETANVSYTVVDLTGKVVANVNEGTTRSEEHTSELQSRPHLVCRLLLEKKKHNTAPTVPLQ